LNNFSNTSCVAEQNLKSASIIYLLNRFLNQSQKVSSDRQKLSKKNIVARTMSPVPSNFQDSPTDEGGVVIGDDSPIPDTSFLAPSSPNMSDSEEDTSPALMIDENDKSVTSTTGLLSAEVISSIALAAGLLHEQDEKNKHIKLQLEDGRSEKFVPHSTYPQVRNL
jgi:hypothetical protein